MPELPEVETIGRALSTALPGRVIKRVEVFTPAMRTSLEPLKTAGLPGHRIESVRRRARYLVVKLDDGRGLVMHFGMTGVVRVESADIPRRKHEHVFLHLDDGMIFRFECVRRFSQLEVHELNADGWPEMFAGFGVEPLTEGFTPEYLYAQSRRRHGAVKPFLMDNAVVTGIGNIYATETLFAARIDPRRPADSLRKTEYRRITEQAKRILTEAIQQGGTTVSDFRHVDGSQGHFAVNLQVYGKAGKPCPVCGTVLTAVKLGGRTSVFCPECQK